MINPGSPPGASPTRIVPGPRFFKAMDVNLCSDKITVHLLSVLQCFPRIAAAIRRFTYLLLSLSLTKNTESRISCITDIMFLRRCGQGKTSESYCYTVIHYSNEHVIVHKYKDVKNECEVNLEDVFF